jgi:hypothetical protein
MQGPGIFAAFACFLCLVLLTFTSTTSKSVHTGPANFAAESPRLTTCVLDRTHNTTMAVVQTLHQSQQQRPTAGKCIAGCAATAGDSMASTMQMQLAVNAVAAVLAPCLHCILTCSFHSSNAMRTTL